MPAPAILPPIMPTVPAAQFNTMPASERLKYLPLSERDLDQTALAKAVLSGIASCGSMTPGSFALWNRIVRVVREEGGSRDLATARYLIGRELLAALKREATGAPISEPMIDAHGLAALDTAQCGIAAWLEALSAEGIFWSPDYRPGEG